MREVTVRIERRDYDPRTETYKIRTNGYARGESIDAAIEALKTFGDHGHTYPSDQELMVTVKAARP